MASPANTEASEVRRRGRQRLIGAIALVAILVVFVPMVLDSEPKAPRQGPTMAIPSKTDAPPLPAPPPAATAKAPDVAPADVAPAKAGAQDVAPAKAGAQASPEPAKVATVTPKTDARSAESKALEPPGSKPAPPKAAPAPVAPAKAGAQVADPPKLEGFAVQVGAFRDASKLDQARQKLAAAKVPHYTERVEAKDGAITRLRAGPYPTRDAAEAALASLKRAALEGKVVPLP